MADEQNARPDELKRKLAALAALIGSVWLAKPSSRLEALYLHSDEIRAAITAIAAWVSAEWGVTVDESDFTGSFMAAISGYLEGNFDQTGEQAKQYAEMVIADQLHALEVQMVQQASRTTGAAQVERRLGYSASGPCPRCIALAGTHPLDFPDLYWTHPHCVCSWHAVAGRAAMSESFADLLRSVFAGRGNPQALRNWYDAGARGQIHWGTPGDFDRCVEIAGKYVSNPQGFCQERHIDSTGHPAGHAPGEAKHAALVNGILDAWRVRFGGS